MWLRAEVSRLMLEEISLNDRGTSAPAHFAALQTQLDPNVELGMLCGYGREVLELEQHTEPDKAYTDRPPTGSRGHIKRMLACTILLRNAARVSVGEHLSDEAFFVETCAGAVIQLARSAIALGKHEASLAIGLLLWVYSEQSHPAFRSFVSFSALLLQVAAGLHDGSGQDLLHTCEWLGEEERRGRELLDYHVASERWLIGLNGYEDSNSRRKIYRGAATQVLAMPHEGFGNDVERALNKIAAKITT